MKIAYLTTVPLPSRRAAAVQIMAMCEAMVRLGHEVTIYTPRSREAEQGPVLERYGLDCEIDVRTYPLTGVRWRGHKLGDFYPGWAARLRGVDLLYARCHAIRPLHATLRHRIPSVFEVHFGHDERWCNEILTAEHVRRIVFQSRAVQSIYDARPDFRSEIGVVLPNGARAPTADPVHAWPDPDGFHVGYIGHLYQGKGMETIAALAPRCPWARFHVIGGRDEDVAAWRERTREIPNLQLHGYIAPAQLDPYRVSFGAILAPYGETVEGYGPGGPDLATTMSPLKVIEAMASGVPLVASKMAIIEELVTDRQTAFLAPPEDIDAWARALEHIRDDREDAKRVAFNARARFREAHTWESRAKQALAGLH